jgi:hypothetical protein
VSPIPSPVLILRNNGPALRRATACHASKALRVPPACQADLGPLPRLVGLSPPNAQPQPTGDDGDVLDVERNQFGAA